MQPAGGGGIFAWGDGDPRRGTNFHEGARIFTKNTFLDGGERMVGVGSGGRLGVADAVADAGDGDDVAGVAGVFVEFAAESSDIGTEGAPAAGGVHAPDVAQELFV